MSATIAAVELPHRFGEPAHQLAAMERALAGLSGVELALFSEAIVTGYVSRRGSFDLGAFAEPLDGPTRARLEAMARASGTAIGAPLVERAGGALYNSYLILDRDGSLLAHYRKRHPWYPEAWATPGESALPLVRLGELVATLAVCFDVHFLEAESEEALDAADVLFFPSAWVDDDESDLRAEILGGIARRHRLTIVNANWGLPDDGGPSILGMGGSRVVGPSGEVVAWARDGAAIARVDRDGATSVD